MQGSGSNPPPITLAHVKSTFPFHLPSHEQATKFTIKETDFVWNGQTLLSTKKEPKRTIAKFNPDSTLRVHGGAYRVGTLEFKGDLADIDKDTIVVTALIVQERAAERRKSEELRLG